MEKKSIVTAISIILGFVILSVSIFFTFRAAEKSDLPNMHRYEMISANEANIIIFDKETGRYWRKFISPNEGPSEWTEEDTDFLR